MRCLLFCHSSWISVSFITNHSQYVAAVARCRKWTDYIYLSMVAIFKGLEFPLHSTVLTRRYREPKPQPNRRSNRSQQWLVKTAETRPVYALVWSVLEKYVLEGSEQKGRDDFGLLHLFLILPSSLIFDLGSRITLIDLMAEWITVNLMFCWDFKRNKNMIIMKTMS